jgi:hypothetical protein
LRDTHGETSCPVEKNRERPVVNTTGAAEIRTSTAQEKTTLGCWTNCRKNPFARFVVPKAALKKHKVWRFAAGRQQSPEAAMA